VRTTGAAARGSRLAEMPWSHVREPGCYLLIEAGDLIRLPDGVLVHGYTPLMLRSDSGARVARLSNDAAEPISNLRALAADHGYTVRF